MKPIFGFFLILFLYRSVLAQTSDPLSAQLNSVFANVNASQVPTGFLKEYGLPFVPLEIFNGVLTDSNKVDASVWRTTYATLLTSRIYGTNPLPDLNTVNTAITNDQNTSSGSFVVPVLYADYNYLRPDAITAHLLTASNNQLYDVAGRSQSPYYSAKVFAASPSVGYASSGTPTFIFPQDIFYNASSRTVSTISVDFGDGRGYQNASWNTPVAANYAAIGTYQITIKIVFTDNSIVSCYTPFQITQLSQALNQAQQGTSCPPNQYFPAVSGVHSGGTAWIRYNSANYSGCKITKPLIVAKGYDLSDAGSSLGIHYGFQDFISDLINQPIPYDLSDGLDYSGYDIIFLDYNTSMDDITRNAALLQDVINWVNAQKTAAGSTEKNVVMGISMGGLVARYCLANMTKQGKDPQTRLLLTDDSPHQGANMPLGLQALTKAFNETTLARVGTAVTFALSFYSMYPAYTQAAGALDEASSQQMLLLHATDGHGGYSTNTFLNSTYRNMITFAPTDPQPAYKVEATSLGSECGVNLLQPSSQLLQVSGNFFLSPLPWISKNSFNTYAVALALPSYGPSQNIMQLRIWTSYTLLSIITINVNLTNKTASSPANTFPWDGVPGGILNVKAQFAQNIPTSKSSWGPFFNWTQGVTGADAFCFVPLVSALDITTINSTALSATYVGGVSPADAARVANFIAEEKFVNSSGTTAYNNSHATLTPRNAEWLFDEITGVANTKNCSSDCTTSYDGLLSGPSPFCSSANFVINNLSSGNTVNWYSSNTSALTITTSTVDHTTGLASQVRNASTSVQVSASVNNNCGTITVKPLNIWVGVPVYNSITLDGSAPQWYANCSAGSIPYTAGPNQHVLQVGLSGASSTNFILNDPSGTIVATVLSPTQYGFFTKRSDLNFSITLSTSNTCGTTQQCIYFSNTPGGCTFPAFTSVTINGAQAGDCSASFSFSPGVAYTISATDNTGTAVTFTLSELDGHHYVTGTTLSSTQYRVTASNSSASFRVTMGTKNNCGSAGWCVYFCNSNCVLEEVVRGPATSLAVYPNPASTSMTVQVTDSLSTDAELSQPFQLSIYNKFSQTVFSTQSSNSSIQIPVDGFPNDIYYINVFYGSAVLRKQIVIKK